MMEKHALIIAAGKYQHAEKYTPLSKTTADAEGLAAALTEVGFNVGTPLIDRTYREVGKAAREFFQGREKKHHLLLLYFCGHGYRDEEGDLYLLQVDSEPEDHHTTALNCKTLSQYIKKSHSLRQLLILDCCHSGAFYYSKNVTSVEEATRAQFSQGDAKAGASARKALIALTSAERHTLAYEHFEGNPKTANSPYCQALIEGLSGKQALDAQGNITAQSLQNYLYEQVFAQSDGKQQPQFIACQGSGDLMLLEKPRAAELALPQEIRKLLASHDPDQRLVGISRLKFLCREQPAQVAAALGMLKSLSKDRDGYVQREAGELLQALQGKTVLNAGQGEPADNTKPASPPKQLPNNTSAKIAEAAQPKPIKAKYSALEVFQDPLKSGGLGPEMVVIPAGSFTMGSSIHEAGRGGNEGPQHKVHVPAFAMGQTPVTFAEYEPFARATQRDLPGDRGWGRGQRPVINVSWHDAQAYAAWLSEQSAAVYRLPSEAEWEYACRAGTATAFNTGESISAQQANFHGSYGKTVPVASYAANGFSLFDMHGNVWQWVQDHMHDNYQGAPTNGSAWVDQKEDGRATRVLRGGSWLFEPQRLRSARRNWFRPDARNFDLGFRLARTL